MTSSDLTPPEHCHSAAVEEAARFLLAVPPAERPKPLVPALREMFDLTPVEACEAIRLSHTLSAGPESFNREASGPAGAKG